jgi:PAS domain S-box-containing protein
MSNELKKSIAEQKQTKLALDESDKTFRLLFDTAPYVIIITNLKGDFINANNKTFEIYKARSKSEFLQYKASHFYANINERQEVIDEIVTKGYIENKEIKFRTFANEIKTFLVSAYTMPSATGEILIVSWQRDITEFKTVQKELEESEVKYKMLTDYSGNIIVMYRNYEKYYINPAVEKILGYTQKECMDINFIDIVHPEYIEKINKYLEKDSINIIEKTYNEDLKIKHKNGHYISISAQIIFHIIDKDNNIIIFNFRDTSYKESSEKEIRRLSTAVNQSPTTIVITNLNGDIEYVNPQFSVITGYTAEEALGRNPRILKSYFHSADFYQNMWSTLLSGKTWKGEVYNKRKDGSYYWEEATIAPILNEKNEIVNYVAIKQDISLRKESELKIKQQNEQLVELNKTKDRFISILAHDLKNPFNAILGYTELITNNFDEYNKEELKEYISIISNSAKDTFNLLENLLEWAYSQQNKVKLNPQKTNLLTITNECLNLARSSALAKNITIRIQIDEQTNVVADKEMIKTVIRNLLTNAIKFTSDDGSVIVKSKQNNDNIEIAITDTGIGMDEKTRNSLFKIGETKSALGTNGERGTGFGLMICKEFIEKHGGNIWVESQKGQGSTFYFTIPVLN